MLIPDRFQAEVSSPTVRNYYNAICQDHHLNRNLAVLRLGTEEIYL